MTVIFFEDQFYANFEPLSLSHVVYSLICGTSRIYKKWLSLLNTSEYGFLCRPYIADLLHLETGKKVNKLPDGELLFINGRFLPSQDLIREIDGLSGGEGLVSGDALIAFRSGSGMSKGTRTNIENIHDPESHEPLLSALKTRRVDALCLSYLWDLVNINERLITEESAYFAEEFGHVKSTDERATFIDPENIFIHESVEIMPSVVLDASNGPVIIEQNTKVESFSYIQGPCYIGPDCRIVGGRIRSGSSFGPVCRVGGEVESSIILGYCNKYHEGFLGHAFLGEWVNLGALTTNSDLKNNYKPISVELSGDTVDTGSIKIGCFIGDHTKTGIGTMLNTGINIGFSCNLYGEGLFSDKSIPSFSWGSPGDLQQYKLFKSMETAEISMQRRNIKFRAAHKELFKQIYDRQWSG